jgi:hypothetical protein
MTSKRACLFCGGPADSREHLLPEWLQNVLPSKELAVHYRQIGGGEKRSWEKKPFTEQARVVCEGCNTGWMSRLEDSAKPILAPAITRSAVCAFDLRAQQIAARWAAKTCFVFQGLAPELLAPPTHPFLLRSNGIPPPQVSVFMGSHYRALQDPANSVYMQKPLSLYLGDGDPEDAPEFGYVCFLAVGGISFLIIGYRDAGYAEVVAGQMVEGLLTKIWPLSTRVIRWPPEMLMDRELVESFFLDNTPPHFDLRFFDLKGAVAVAGG